MEECNGVAEWQDIFSKYLTSFSQLFRSVPELPENTLKTFTRFSLKGTKVTNIFPIGSQGRASEIILKEIC